MIRILFAVMIFMVACTVAGCEKSQTSGSAGTIFSGLFGRSYNYDDILVSRAVDGDTLKLENGEYVRLIGIDTPELHESAKLYRDARKSGQDVATIQRLGKKASDFTHGLVDKQRVRLEFDVEKKDKYNRLLAYVHLKDGTFVNAEIVKQGYASPYTFPPNVRYVDLFRQLYREARENTRGLWSEKD